jgi:large repetitive protein
VTRLLRILLVFGVLAAIFVADAAAYKVDRTVTPPAGAVGSPYTFTFVTSGGTAPHTFSVFTGSLPPGLGLSTDGVLSGTPTQSGSFSFWIAAHDSGSAMSQAPFTMSIDSKLTVTTGSIPAATRGVPYSTTLTVSGGSATSWTLSSGTLPPGFTLSNSGVLAGTATSEGSTTFTVKAANGSKSDSKTLTLSVVAPLGISVGAIPPAIVGQPFAARLAATGGMGTYTFVLMGGAFPSGLLLDTTSGVISGTPRSAGSYPFQIAVNASGGGSVVQTLRLVVRAKLAIATKKLPTARVGHRYVTQIVVKGGILPFSLTSSSLFPRGLSLNGETGLLTGKALRTGHYSITLVVHDSYGGTATRRLTLRVTR